MTTRFRAALLAVASMFAASWAAYLIRVHQAAVAHTLEPGVLCGVEGGCGDVLASEWSTIGGWVAVSAPAVPLFGALAVLALLAGAGRADLRRISGLAVGSSLVGVCFGGALLYVMIAEIGAVCRYCLVMDGATMAVGLGGLVVHPDGPRGALRQVPSAIRALVRPGPELATLGAVIVGTVALAVLVPEPTGPTGAIVAVHEAAADTPPPLASAVVERASETRRVVIPAGRVEIALDESTPVKGPADAPLTVVLFEDFQCPYCRKLTGYLEAFRQERPDEVRIAWFDFPMHSGCNARPGMKDMHPQACAAAVAGECARRQGKFWELHDRLFQTGQLDAAALARHASALGLDPTEFQACQEDPAALEAVLADTRVGQRFNISGTPTFFMNGKRFSGAQPVEALRAIADALKAGPADKVLLDVPIEGEIVGDVVSTADEVEVRGPRGLFWIDAFEASVVDGRARSVAGAMPSLGLSWAQASAACEAAGKRLCAEDEWLTACTGAIPVDADGDGTFSDDPIAGRAHPYGAYPQPTWCASARNRDDGRPVYTGNHPRCVTPEGVHDLEGSAKEWVGLSPHQAALQGGSRFSKESARCAYHKSNESPDVRDDTNGFRCCRGPAPVSDGSFAGGRVGERVMDWTAAVVDGGTTGAKALEGKAYLINFWATWCGPCRKELPALVELAQRYRSEGLEVVAVSIDADRRKLDQFLSSTPLDLIVAHDPTSALKDRFDAPTTPTTFFVTKSGVIRQRNVGYDADAGVRELEADVAALLAAP